MRVTHWLLALLSFGFTLTAYAQPNLTTFDNTYSAKLYGFNVAVTSRLTAKENNIYEFYFDVNAIIGNVTEVSQFKWNEQGHYAIPTIYTYKRKGLGKNRDQELNFDWTKNEVTNVKDNTSLTLDATKKIQDGLSYQVQLRQDLMAGKTDLHYFITDGKKTKDYKFEILGEEVLDTPLGQVTALKIKRSEVNDKRAIYAWFAKDFQHLLVRLQQEENGSAYTIYISKASINGKAIEHF
jgi:hypothetical protein